MASPISRVVSAPFGYSVSEGIRNKAEALSQELHALDDFKNFLADFELDDKDPHAIKFELDLNGEPRLSLNLKKAVGPYRVGSNKIGNDVVKQHFPDNEDAYELIRELAELAVGARDHSRRRGPVSTSSSSTTQQFQAADTVPQTPLSFDARLLDDARAKDAAIVDGLRQLCQDNQQALRELIHGQSRHLAGPPPSSLGTDRMVQAIEDLAAQIANLERTIAGLSLRLSSGAAGDARGMNAPGARDLAEKLAIANGANTVLEKQLEACAEERDRLKEEVRAQGKTIGDNNQIIEDLHAKLKEKNEELDKLQKELTRLRAENETQKGQIAELTADNDRLSGELQEKQRTINELNEELDRLRKQLKEKDQKIKELTEKLGAANDQVQALTAERDQLRTDKETLQTTLAANELTINALRDQINSHQAHISALTKENNVQAQHIADLKNENHQLTAEVEQGQTTIRNLTQANETLNKSLEEKVKLIEGLTSLNRDLIGRIRFLTDELADVREELTTANGKLAKNDDSIQQQQAKLQEQEDELTRLKELVQTLTSQGQEKDQRIAALETKEKELLGKLEDTRATIARLEDENKRLKEELEGLRRQLQEKDEAHRLAVAKLEKRNTATQERLRIALESNERMSADFAKNQAESERTLADKKRELEELEAKFATQGTKLGETTQLLQTNIEQLTAAQQALVDAQKKFKTMHMEHAKQVLQQQMMIDKLNQDKRALKTALNELVDKKEQLESELIEAKSIIATQEDELREMKPKLAYLQLRTERLSKDNARQAADIQNLTKDRGELRHTVETQARELMTVTIERDMLQERIPELEKQIHLHKEHEATQRDRLAKLETQYNLQKPQLEELQNKLAKQEATVERQSSILKAKEAELVDLRRMELVQGSAIARLTAENAELRAEQKRRGQNQAATALQLQEQLNHVRNESDELERLKKLLSDLRIEHNGLGARYTALQTAHENLLLQLGGKEQKIARLNSDLDLERSNHQSTRIQLERDKTTLKQELGLKTELFNKRLEELQAEVYSLTNMGPGEFETEFQQRKTQAEENIALKEQIARLTAERDALQATAISSDRTRTVARRTLSSTNEPTVAKTLQDAEASLRKIRGASARAKELLAKLQA